MKKKESVYFLQLIGMRYVKIGYSSNETPLERINSYITGAPLGINLLGFIQCENAKELESRLHKKFSSKRMKGEWFDITTDEVEELINTYNDIEFLKEKSDFEVAWMESKSSSMELISLKSKKKQLEIFYKKGDYKNKSDLAKKLNITRKTLYNWIKEYEANKNETT